MNLRFVVIGIVALGVVILGVAAGIYWGLIPTGNRVAVAQAPAAAAPATGPAPAAAPVAQAQPAAPPAAAMPAPPEVTDRRAIGDWIYGCVATAGDRLCSITQQLNQAQSNALLFQWQISKAADGTIVSAWQTPTGVQVSRGMLLDAGTPQPITIPYASCLPGNCNAIANLAPDFQQSLASAQSLTATIYAVDGRGLAFTFSPNGLAEALTALRDGE